MTGITSKDPLTLNEGIKSLSKTVNGIDHHIDFQIR